MSPTRWHHALLLLYCTLGVTACGDAEDVTHAGGGGTAGTSMLPDAALFDCTATGLPERSNPLPTTCATNPICPERLVSGHRGVGGPLGVLAPEDTLAAVRAAVVLGVDFVETDPRPTKDGVLVNLHDTTVDRTTYGSGAAADMTLAEIQSLHIDAGTLAGDFSCERVPTLEELLTLARGRVHVLIDANKTDRVDLLVSAVHASDTLDWAIFDTDDPNKIAEALTLEPALHTMIRVADAAELDAELSAFADHPPVIVELHDGATVATLVPLVHAAGNRALADVFAIDLVAKFSNDPAAYAPVFENEHMDIAQTDRPDLVLRYLGR